MQKRKKMPPKKSEVDRFALIETALRKLKKDELIEQFVMLAKHHDDVHRELESTLKIEKPVGLLLSDTSDAIERATNFDERMLNYNFSVDWQAYEEVETGLRKLVQTGHLDEAKLLALELMKQGSYQVECSDEGLMSDDIESCLTHVIKAMKKVGGDDAQQWATQMIAADRVGFICNCVLKKLQSGKK